MKHDALKIDAFKVYFHNKEELLRLKKEIFSQHQYYLELSPTAVIIDAGAHIGLATLYFKKQYPAAQVTAIEPQPQNFALLEKNVWENNLDDVVTLNAALATQEGQIELHTDEQQNWLSTTSVVPQAWNGQQDTKPIFVPAITLSSLLTHPIDLLKLDIEGQEFSVLQEAQDKLYLIHQMLIEFHPHAGQTLDDVIELLESKHFQLHFSKNGAVVNPRRTQGLVLIHALQK